MGPNIKCINILAPLGKSANKKLLASVHTDISYAHPEYFCGGWEGGLAVRLYKSMLNFKSYVKKIMSKSLSQHLAVVAGKIKTNWRRKMSTYL